MNGTTADKNYKPRSLKNMTI